MVLISILSVTFSYSFVKYTSSYLPTYMHTHLRAYIYLHTLSDIIKESYASVVGSYGCRDFRGCNVSPPNCSVMY